MIRSHDKDCFGTFVPRSLEVSASMITFVLINTLVFRLLVFVDLLGTDVYDRGEIVYNIEITIEELYNYCLEYNNILENC